MGTESSSNPMEFLRNLWGTSGVPLPGMLTPTLDADELNRRIADLKTVESWLKVNLSMLQVTIQGLEVQAATLNAVESVYRTGTGQKARSGKENKPAEAIVNVAKSSLNLMKDTFSAATATTRNQATKATRRNQATINAKPKSR